MQFFTKSAVSQDALLDTTLRPLCFGIEKEVTGAIASAVGAEKFKRYEHALYIMAQCSRLVYCDTGIMWAVIEKSFGLSNDVVNKVISAYDWKYRALRRSPITSQPGDGSGRPMESYSLFPSKGGEKYGTYISTPDDVTCVFLKAHKLAANPNSIFLPTDVICSFKGSSTMQNFKHDLMSQFSAADLGKLVQSIGITISGENNLVTGAFVVPLVKAWTALMAALEEFAGGRLFLTGHSLGGSYASLFALILCEGKSTIPALAKVTSIHLVTFGAACIVRDAARNLFNKHLDSGYITLDRVVSQKVAARSAATQVLLGGIAGPNDVIPTIPAGFSHPGYRPLNNPMKNFKPEAKGRPYSIENIRTFYGAPSKNRYREPSSWPFSESIGLGDRQEAAALKEIVTNLTNVTDQPTEADPVAPVVKLPENHVESDPTTPNIKVNSNSSDPSPQAGGGKNKAIYEADTLKRIPNFISVRGSSYAYGFAHAEYLGMFFFGGFRLLGMKNPASKNVAMFDLCIDGIKVHYVAPVPVSKSIEALNTLAKASDPQAGGTRKRKKFSKKTRKAYK